MTRSAAPRWGSGRATRAVLAAGALVGLGVGLLQGCSGGSGGDGQGGSGGSGGEGPLTTTVTMGPVTGRLTPRERSELQRSVGEVVDRWFAAAYLRDDPQAAGDRFPGFTDGAVPRTAADRQVMSLGSLAGKIDSVTATRRAVRVEPLVVDGEVVGVTARFILEFDTTGDRAEHDSVRGRLLLTPHDDSWQVFGYDVTAGATGKQPVSASSSPEAS